MIRQFFVRSTRSTVLELELDAGPYRFFDLIRSADALIESADFGATDALGIGYGTLSKVNPDLAYTAITPFGSTGSKVGRAATDLTVMAIGAPESLYRRHRAPRVALRARASTQRVRGAAESGHGGPPLAAIMVLGQKTVRPRSPYRRPSTFSRVGLHFARLRQEISCAIRAGCLAAGSGAGSVNAREQVGAQCGPLCDDRLLAKWQRV